MELLTLSIWYISDVGHRCERIAVRMLLSGGVSAMSDIAVPVMSDITGTSPV